MHQIWLHIVNRSAIKKQTPSPSLYKQDKLNYIFILQKVEIKIITINVTQNGHILKMLARHKTLHPALKLGRTQRRINLRSKFVIDTQLS